jgi:hypothetical protein
MQRAAADVVPQDEHAIPVEAPLDLTASVARCAYGELADLHARKDLARG